MTGHTEPQLSALALLDAYRSQSFDAVRNVVENTDGQELYLGLVRLADQLLVSMAVRHGLTADEMTAVWRRGLLAAAE